jgi:hypothetical protein
VEREVGDACSVHGHSVLIACFGVILFFFTLLCINAVRMLLMGFYALARAGYLLKCSGKSMGYLMGKALTI